MQFFPLTEHSMPVTVLSFRSDCDAPMPVPTTGTGAPAATTAAPTQAAAPATSSTPTSGPQAPPDVNVSDADFDNLFGKL